MFFCTWEHTFLNKLKVWMKKRTSKGSVVHVAASECIVDSALTSRPRLPWWQSHKLSTWPPCCTVLTDGINAWSEFESGIQMKVIYFISNECNLPHLIACYLSRHDWMFAMTYFEVFVPYFRSLLLCCYALACRPFTASTLRAYRAEYYIWLADWLELLGWLAARNHMFVNFTRGYVLVCWCCS